jgi:pyruvate dehydrogenase E2 component (dihydrolipoamide acetyltransferase)
LEAAEDAKDMTTPILMPTIDPATRSGRLTRWFRREGDFVEAGEPVAEIAAARATMDIEAPHAGVLIRIIAEAGGHDIAVESVLALIDAAPEPEPEQMEPTQVETAQAEPERAGRTPISPRARRLAQASGLDPSGLSGSGPNGRIVESDVQAALTSIQAPAQKPLKGFLTQAPQVALEAEIRMDALESLRERRNEALADEAARISLADCALKALALALQREPRANVAHAGEGYVPARRSDVALVVTVDGGTVTPVFVAADTLPLEAIAAARAGFAAPGPQGLQQASSLVIDFGPYGVLRAFPVLVAPFTTVLALGVAEKRVVVEDGVPDVAEVMSVTLTFDRGAMDEAAGAALLAAFRTVLENPAEMLG